MLPHSFRSAVTLGDAVHADVPDLFPRSQMFSPLLGFWGLTCVRRSIGVTSLCISPPPRWRCLSRALSVGGSQPRITVSVVEVARPEQHRERGCCGGLGQGLLWASRFSWPGSRSLAENPRGQLVGVKTHSHSPAIPWTEVRRVRVTEQDIINKSLINQNYTAVYFTTAPIGVEHTLTSQGLNLLSALFK